MGKIQLNIILSFNCIYEPMHVCVNYLFSELYVGYFLVQRSLELKVNSGILKKECLNDLESMDIYSQSTWPSFINS